ncbi:hypothetical protein PMIN01_13451 [Paraphaeosphaeria minitans]|uniref:RNase H type-1 domain-containing protein n=1 Tax=Paraphaeosphaeria minitans TaxID=565426 RepID=A0A9P6G513_9PLEO|nr:hypothetical protein PMIN01_13451 [Paraphaeosphaeria minitans]
MPYVISPWSKRITTTAEPDLEKATALVNQEDGIKIATSTSARRGNIGAGWAILDTQDIRADKPHTSSAILGPREEQNPYVAELFAIAGALEDLGRPHRRRIMILTRNLAALQVVRQPRRQSGQHIIQRIYRTIQDLEMLENKVDLIWITVKCSNALTDEAKKAAKRTTQEGSTPCVRQLQAKSTVINTTMAKAQAMRTLPDGTGAYSKRIDAALPGRHTRRLYDNLSRQEATVLAQLRTGMIRLNAYLYQIRAADSRACPCGHTETPEHFLFRCARWDTLREQMLEQSDTLRGSLSFYLGGRAKTDPAKTWAPSIEAVKATIRYAIATKRLETASGT